MSGEVGADGQLSGPLECHGKEDPVVALSQYTLQVPCDPRRTQGRDGDSRSGIHYLIRMSFLTDFTPWTPRAIAVALSAAACDVTKPLS